MRGWGRATGSARSTACSRSCPRPTSRSSRQHQPRRRASGPFTSRRTRCSPIWTRLPRARPRPVDAYRGPNAVPHQAADGAGEEPLPLDRGTLQTLLAVDGHRSVRDIVDMRQSMEPVWHLASLAEVGLDQLQRQDHSGHASNQPGTAALPQRSRRLTSRDATTLITAAPLPPKPAEDEAARYGCVTLPETRLRGRSRQLVRSPHATASLLRRRCANATVGRATARAVSERPLRNVSATDRGANQSRAEERAARPQAGGTHHV